MNFVKSMLLLGAITVAMTCSTASAGGYGCGSYGYAPTYVPYRPVVRTYYKPHYHSYHAPVYRSHHYGYGY